MANAEACELACSGAGDALIGGRTVLSTEPGAVVLSVPPAVAWLGDGCSHPGLVCAAVCQPAPCHSRRHASRLVRARDAIMLLCYYAHHPDPENGRLADFSTRDTSSNNVLEHL